MVKLAQAAPYWNISHSWSHGLGRGRHWKLRAWIFLGKQWCSHSFIAPGIEFPEYSEILFTPICAGMGEEHKTTWKKILFTQHCLSERHNERVGQKNCGENIIIKDFSSLEFCALSLVERFTKFRRVLVTPCSGKKSSKKSGSF